MASFLLLSDRGLVYPYQRKSEGRDDRIFLSPWPNLEGEAPAEPPDRLGRSLALQARNEITTDGLYAYGAKSELCDGVGFATHSSVSPRSAPSVHPFRSAPDTWPEVVGRCRGGNRP